MFGLLALWIWNYEPKMLVEHDDGSESFEHVPGTHTSFTERARVFLAIVFLYIIALAVYYHEFLWEMFWQNVNL